MRPPDAIPFRFGPGSAEKHRAEARQRGVAVHALETSTLAFDVDTPQDFYRYLAVEEGLASIHEAEALASRRRRR
jgi:2-phospho-L-lactate guanylyltransferase